MKQIFFFLLLAINSALIAQTTKITSSTLSSSLKAAMTTKGFYPQLNANDDVYLSGTRGVCVGQTNDGLCRAILNSNAFSDAAPEPDFVRAWTRNTLVQFITSKYYVTNYTETQQGATWTISFKINGVTYSNSNNNDAEAMGNAVLSAINSN